MGPEPDPRKDKADAPAATAWWRGKGVLIALFAAGLLLNLGLLRFYYAPKSKAFIGDEIYNYVFAKRMAAGEEVALDPAWPALYIKSLEKSFALFGVDPLPVQIVQIVMWLVAAFLFYRIAVRLLPWRGAALAAAALFLFSPEMGAFSHYLWPEIPHVFFFILALWLVICHRERTLALLAAGVIFGLSLLTKLVAQPFIPVILLFIVILGKGTWRYRILRGCLFGVVVFVTILPTMLGNYKTHGKLMIADSSIFNLWLGLIDEGRVDYEKDLTRTEFGAYFRSGKDIATRNSIYMEKIGDLVAERGIVKTLLGQLDKQYFRLFDCHSFFTTQLPDGPRRTYRTENAGLVKILRGWSYLAHGLLLAAFGFGVCFVRFRPVGWVHCLLLFVVYNLGIFLFLHSKTRYMIQFLPMLALFGGVALFFVFRFVLRRRPEGGDREAVDEEPGFVVSRVRVACGAVVAAIFLMFGFWSLI